MSVVRVVKNNQYTVIHNAPLQDSRLSLKARGLLAYCFSLPENWSYSIEGLVKAIGSDGRDSIRAGLKELEERGYLKRRRLHDAAGKFTDTEYIIYETAQTAEEESGKENTATEPPGDGEEPITENPSLAAWQGLEPVTENPALVNPALEKPTSGNRLQQSKYIKNKYKTTTTEVVEKDTETDNALPAELSELAKRCCVSEKTVRAARNKFGIETVQRHLKYMAKQSGIQNPNAWLMQSLREAWDMELHPGKQPRADCPECKGAGYTLLYHRDPKTDARLEVKVNCPKCCNG